ncbi:hypothetical protein FB451DRAFT_1185885 [Mycena latifolia]|nr:hypothetical protein FB451DRAFT_1185885 [Mycena latifolia]
MTPSSRRAWAATESGENALSGDAPVHLAFLKAAHKRDLGVMEAPKGSLVRWNHTRADKERRITLPKRAADTNHRDAASGTAQEEGRDEWSPLLKGLIDAAHDDIIAAHSLAWSSSSPPPHSPSSTVSQRSPRACIAEDPPRVIGHVIVALTAAIFVRFIVIPSRVSCSSSASADIPDCGAARQPRAWTPVTRWLGFSSSPVLEDSRTTSPPPRPGRPLVRNPRFSTDASLCYPASFELRSPSARSASAACTHGAISIAQYALTFVRNAATGHSGRPAGCSSCLCCGRSWLDAGLLSTQNYSALRVVPSYPYLSTSTAACTPPTVPSPPGTGGYFPAFPSSVPVHSGELIPMLSLPRSVLQTPVEPAFLPLPRLNLLPGVLGSAVCVTAVVAVNLDPPA